VKSVGKIADPTKINSGVTQQQQNRHELHKNKLTSQKGPITVKQRYNTKVIQQNSHPRRSTYRQTPIGRHDNTTTKEWKSGEKVKVSSAGPPETHRRGNWATIQDALLTDKLRLNDPTTQLPRNGNLVKRWESVRLDHLRRTGAVTGLLSETLYLPTNSD
jgi:hypothetical protein